MKIWIVRIGLGDKESAERSDLGDAFLNKKDAYEYVKTQFQKQILQLEAHLDHSEIGLTIGNSYNITSFDVIETKKESK